ncbi:unnamed protein product, partial [Durusdinium trenchii]
VTGNYNQACYSDYKSIVVAIADGGEPDAEHIRDILLANDKTVEDLQDDVKLLIERRELRKQYDALPELHQRKAENEQKIAEVDQELEAAKQRHHEQTAPFYNRLYDINHAIKLGLQAEQQLFQTCNDEELLTELEQLGEEEHREHERQRKLDGDIRELRRDAESCRQESSRTNLRSRQNELLAEAKSLDVQHRKLERELTKAKSKKWWGRYKDENGSEKRVPLAADKKAAQAMLNEIVKKVEYRKVESLLATFRDGGISTQTSNHYLRAIKQFTRWMVKDRRSAEDPIAFVAMLNVRTDRRHDRRPLTETELRLLIQAAMNGQVEFKMSGADRAMLYATAAYTGLRANELASLNPESFQLDAQPPTVTVLAAYSKHRRQDVLPLHPSLVVMLRPWLSEKQKRKSVWSGNWAKRKYGGKMLKRDLKSAGIPYVDENGLYADFHALRHTFITNMVKSGVNPKTAQALARHSTIDLTMNVYTSLTVSDQASALANLPAVPSLNAPVSQTGSGKVSS